MSVQYRAVQWNKHKRTYDLVIAVGVVGYLLAFTGLGMVWWPGDSAAHPVTLLMRGTSTAAFTLLTLILCIGPLARLWPGFNVLLYNRRHLGVTMFLVALLHAALAVFWYHGFGVVNPIVSVFTSNSNYLPNQGQTWRQWLHGFPYQPLGVAALVIFFLMAATSHDFWLKNLSPRVWKSLHMAVYAAYALVVLHVVFGFLQTEGLSPVYAVLVVGSAAMVVGLHLVAGLRQQMAWKPGQVGEDGWVDAARVEDLDDQSGHVVALPDGTEVALFRDGAKVSAVGNVCAHQGGPLGEGKIVNGCVTCPWHGYQYRATDGQSPPPYREKIPTYALRIEHGRVRVNPQANPPGTAIEPATLGEQHDGA